MKEVKLISGGAAVDDRGSVRFVNDFNFSQVKRFYQVQNHKKGFIRAWHGHKNEGKYVYACKGSFLVGAVKMKETVALDGIADDAIISEEGLPQKFILSSESPKVLWIPPGYANGFMSLTEDGIIQFFSTSSLEDSLNDDIRFDYNKWNIWKEDFR